MKISKILSACLLASLAMTTSCDGEKDLIIIEGNLPIKTNTLYLVGDATPVGWNINDPEPLMPSADDPNLFVWEGTLFKGEFKACLISGSWDNAFLRPVEAGTPVTKQPIVAAEFVMWAGDPDNKWVVIDEGRYHIEFNLKNWTMSTRFLGESEGPAITPIEAEEVYIVGDATPCGWNIDAPYAITKASKYIFEYEGILYPGELKACIQSGDWGVPFIRPASPDETIGKNGVSSDSFVFAAAPDNKWKITDAGNYHLTFDLENWTIKAEYLGELVVDKTPIDTETLYLIGDATPGGWDMGQLSAMTKAGDYTFTWRGTLIEGDFKACLEPDPTYSCAFVRPDTEGVVLSAAGFSSADITYTVAPDDKWTVLESGTYEITIDLENYTVSGERVGDAEVPDVPEPVDPSEELANSDTLYLIGDATPGGWDMGSLTAMTHVGTTFTWEGDLNTGVFKACIAPDGSYSCPFVRPTMDGVTVSSAGVSDPNFVYTTDPDDKWTVTESGRYAITFDIAAYTIEVERLGDVTPGVDPYEVLAASETLYLIGGATPGGWDWGQATPMTRQGDAFVWTGELATGEFKAATETGSWSVPFVRPATEGVEVSADGVSDSQFIYTTETETPDYKWNVVAAGTYTITIDVVARTIDVAYVE